MMMPEKNTAYLSSALFAVVFFDGEREIDLGLISISPAMNFKAFQSLISQKIGISPHQITTYFTPLKQIHHQRRRPVTSKFDFAAALLESATSYFWVVLKRSRRVRRRKPKTVSPESEADNFVILRPNPNLEYLRDVAEIENYLMSLNLNSNVYSDLRSPYYGGALSSDDGASSSGGGSENRAVYCETCSNARMEGETPPFHWCKNDAITLVYRSPAGPIAPPAKKKIG